MTEKNIPEIQKERYKALRRAIAERVLVLDGSMGVMIASLGLSESQFRGSRFVRHASPLRGNNDVLNITSGPSTALIYAPAQTSLRPTLSIPML